MTTYLNPSGEESYQFWKRDLCVICGSQQDANGDCFCRFCVSCSQWWLATTRADGIDGRPRVEDCPDCLAVEVTV